MLKQNILQKDYTQNSDRYQFKLPLNIECMIPADESVRLVNQCVEAMDLTDLYSTYIRVPENTPPRTLLKLEIYSFMDHDYTSRSMETNCKRDINNMYLLAGAQIPDYVTFARFRSIHFAPCAKRIMAEFTNLLYELGEISGEYIFIDGTKIEANANRYTFVWKKATSKNLEKLLNKIAVFVKECETLYGIKVAYRNQIQKRHVTKLRKKLYALAQEEGIVFVHGTGKRKNPLQRSIETLEEYLAKLKEYTKSIHTCGERNSYSKTDADATFMRMKEDHMGNGQLKPGYNLQHGVDSEYITWLTIGPQATDTTTLVPFLKETEEYLAFKYQKIIADAGYESEENYVFMEDNGQLSFIKPSNHEISKTRKFQNDISRVENMDYNEEEDFYICKNNKKLIFTGIKNEKSKTGYRSEKSIYVCEDCNGCPYKAECIKGRNCNTPLEERTKQLNVSKKFKEKRAEDLERILTEEGQQLRMNRSIQAEGSFGELKQDMGFRRYLCRGSQNVLAESVLLALAHNINKLHNKIQGERTGTHLFALKKSA